MSFRAAVKFMPGDAEMMRQVAYIPVLNTKLYDEQPGRWIPAPYGPLDTRLVKMLDLKKDFMKIAFLIFSFKYLTNLRYRLCILLISVQHSTLATHI